MKTKTKPTKIHAVIPANCLLFPQHRDIGSPEEEQAFYEEFGSAEICRFYRLLEKLSTLTGLVFHSKTVPRLRCDSSDKQKPEIGTVKTTSG